MPLVCVGGGGFICIGALENEGVLILSIDIHKWKFKLVLLETVEKHLSIIGPLAEIEQTFVQCQGIALTTELRRVADKSMCHYCVFRVVRKITEINLISYICLTSPPPAWLGRMQ